MRIQNVLPPVGIALALTLGVTPALAFEVLACNTATLDTGTPQCDSDSGSGYSAPEAMNDLAQEASSVDCAPCFGSGCALESATGSGQDVNPGQGGSVAVAVNQQTGLCVIAVGWGTGSSMRVTCTACQM